MRKRRLLLALGALLGAGAVGLTVTARRPGPPAPAARRLAPPIAPEPSADAPAPPPIATEDSPLVLGTHHPYQVLDADADERWAVVCQARDDTNHDGVFFAGHSYFPVDRMRPYLFRGEGPGEAIDVYLGADPTGRFVAFRRGRALRLLDAATGHERDLDPAHEVDLERESQEGSPGRQIWFGPGVALMPVRSAARPGRALADWIDLTTGQRRRLDLGEGRLWRAAIDRSGAWVRAHIAVRDADHDGVVELPRDESTQRRRPHVDELSDMASAIMSGDAQALADAAPGPDPCIYSAAPSEGSFSGDQKSEEKYGYRTAWFRAGESVPVAPPGERLDFRGHELPHREPMMSSRGRALLPFDEQIGAHEWMTGLLTDAAMENTHGGRRFVPRGPFHWARPGAPGQRPRWVSGRASASWVVPADQPVETWRDDPGAPCVVYSPLTVTREPLPARFAAPLAVPDDSRRYGVMYRNVLSPSEQQALPWIEDAPPDAHVQHRLAQLDPEMIARYRRLMAARAAVADEGAYLSVDRGGCELLARLVEGGIPQPYRADIWRILSSCEDERFDRLFRRPDVPEEARSFRLDHDAHRHDPDRHRCDQDRIEPRRCRTPVPTLWSRRPEHRAARIEEATRCVDAPDQETPLACLESLASVDWERARSLLPRFPASESREEALRLLSLFATREAYEAKLRSLGLGGPRSGDANDWLLSDRVPAGDLVWNARQETAVRFWDDIEENLYALSVHPGSPLAGVAALEPRGPCFDRRPAMVAYVGGERFEASLEQLAEGLLTTAEPSAQPELVVQQAFVGFVNSIARHRGSDQRYVQLRGGWRVVQVSEALACEIRSLGLRKRSTIPVHN